MIPLLPHIIYHKSFFHKQLTFFSHILRFLVNELKVIQDGGTKMADIKISSKGFVCVTPLLPNRYLDNIVTIS